MSTFKVQKLYADKSFIGAFGTLLWNCFKIINSSAIKKHPTATKMMKQIKNKVGITKWTGLQHQMLFQGDQEVISWLQHRLLKIFKTFIYGLLPLFIIDLDFSITRTLYPGCYVIFLYRLEEILTKPLSAHSQSNQSVLIKYNRILVEILYG